MRALLQQDMREWCPKLALALAIAPPSAGAACPICPTSAGPPAASGSQAYGGLGVSAEREEESSVVSVCRAEVADL